MEKILIIDDCPGIRDNMAELLSMEQYRVCTAASGQEGIELFGRFTPDLVLCDVFMPGMSGYEVFSVIRRQKHGRKIPFVFMTCDVTSEGKYRGLEAGADDYLMKPFDQVELLAVVRRRINNMREADVSLELQKRHHIEALESILSTISHEMRNPICSSVGLSGLLENALNSPDELRTILAGMGSNARTLNDITAHLSETLYAAIQFYRSTLR